MTKDETEEERKPLLENSNGIISQCANNKRLKKCNLSAINMACRVVEKLQKQTC